MISINFIELLHGRMILVFLNRMSNFREQTGTITDIMPHNKPSRSHPNNTSPHLDPSKFAILTIPYETFLPCSLILKRFYIIIGRFS